MPNEIEAVNQLSADINKAPVKDSDSRDVVGPLVDELTLSVSDDEIIRVTEEWKDLWDSSTVKSEWEKTGKSNVDYWKGKQYTTPGVAEQRPNIDNMIFESLETFLPMATRKNPEPVVSVSRQKDDPFGAMDSGNPQIEQMKDAEEKQANLFAKQVKDDLIDIADVKKLRLKIKKAARHWSIYYVGVVKLGWDLDRNIPSLRAIRPSKMILDPEGTVDEDGYTGRFTGEYRKMQAVKLVMMIDEERKAVKELVKSKMGTEVEFIEWWTDEYTCWTLDGHILLKKNNPLWNYDAEEAKTNVDEYGVETQKVQQVQGTNHFAAPRKPYVFLSIFNLGKTPVDDTGLVEQNLAAQDRINKRLRQIDANVDDMNGGLVISQEASGLSESQAKSVVRALRNKGAVVIPSGNPDAAIKKFTPSGLPGDVYSDLNSTRGRLLDVFGVRGSTPSGIANEQTVRGKVITRTLDSDRVGGGITEYLEQFADDIYNWWVQLLYVYDEYYLLNASKAPTLVVSVKEGSLLPKDTLTLANQAIELALAGKMSTLDLYKRLDYPNPEELAANVWLEANAPDLLYKNSTVMQEYMQRQAMMAQAQAGLQPQQQQGAQAGAPQQQPQAAAPSQPVVPEQLPTKMLP